MKPYYSSLNSRKTYQLRQDLRISASFLVNVSLGNGRTVFGKIEDLSLNGAKLRLPISLTSEESLVLDFADYQLTIKAACRWSIPHDLTAGTYLTGVHFKGINSQQYARLRQILFNLAG